MTIGIYGGSFNPIHKGHTNLAHSLVEQGVVDEVWLLVSPLNPLKQAMSSDIAPYEYRLRMAELAVESIDGVVASDFESHLPIPSYTIATLDALCTAYPEHEFSLVIGADNWASFPQWYKADELIARYRILIYRRQGYEIDESTLPPSVQLIDTPLYNISSTEIRASLTDNRQWVDERVAEYITTHKLYNQA